MKPEYLDVNALMRYRIFFGLTMLALGLCAGHGESVVVQAVLGIFFSGFGLAIGYFVDTLAFLLSRDRFVDQSGGDALFEWAATEEFDVPIDASKYVDIARRYKVGEGPIVTHLRIG
jgi:hypothetical protein